MRPREIVERIMTQHWDMIACSCWVCVEGREAGCRPRQPYPTCPAGEGRFTQVKVAPYIAALAEGRQ